jgi:glycosyltransferase involved in cell wall biosynthesis
MDLKLSFIVTCKGRLGHLMEALPTMAAQAGTETIVVDYDCPDGTATWVRSRFPQVKLLWIENEPVFNVSRARNRGAALADSDWLAFVDADTRVHPGFAEEVLPLLEPSAFYQSVHGRAELMGCVILPRAAFAAVRGYDDVLEGWGGEDRDLYQRLEGLGLRPVELRPHLLDAIPHGAELRTRFHHQKDQFTAWIINRMYLEAKQGLAALTGKDTPLSLRRRIHREVEAEVLAARAGGRAPAFSFSEGWRPFLGDHEVDRQLTVRVRRAARP